MRCYCLVSLYFVFSSHIYSTKVVCKTNILVGGTHYLIKVNLSS